MNGRGPPQGRGPRGAPGTTAPPIMGRRLLFLLLLSTLLCPGTDSSMSSAGSKATLSNIEDIIRTTQDGSSSYDDLEFISMPVKRDEDEPVAEALNSSDQYTTSAPAPLPRSISSPEQMPTAKPEILMTNPDDREASASPKKPFRGNDAKASGLIDGGIVTQGELTTKSGGPQDDVISDTREAYDLKAEATLRFDGLKSGNYQFVDEKNAAEELSDIVTQSVTDVGKDTASSSRGGVVWGEVGRGLVAASSGDDRGEGRRPALLVPGTASRGRARSGPYFEEDSPFANVTAPAGSTILLDCRIAMLHDKVVTWAARRADRLQLLTVGKQPYSADRRVALSFRYPNNWRLRIQGARRNDQGLYECQVAAHPPIIRQIYLTVISPEVSIFDESGRSVVERYYKAGSFLQLTCSAVQLLEPPSLLSWWQGSTPLTEGINCNVTGPDSATCTLVVDHVSRSHAGTYTCGTGPAALQTAAALDPTATGTPTGSVDPTAPTSGVSYSANASVAVHVLHGNLIGVAVLPNTGKSIGAKGGSNISVQELILVIAVTLFIQSR